MKNRIKTYVVTSILLAFSFYFLPLNAANLFATDVSPVVMFDDTDKFDYEWGLAGNQNDFHLYSFVSGRYLLDFKIASGMQLNMTSAFFEVKGQAGNSIIHAHDNAPLSLDISNLGNIGLGSADHNVTFTGGDVFIDGSLNRLGLGTTTPVDDLEIKATTPSISFSDTSAGSTDWFMGNFGNDFKFYTLANGTGGPANTQIMTLDAETGFVGMGAATTPTAELHVKGAANRVNLIVENSGPGAAKLNLKNSESNWLFNANSTLRVTTGGVTAELFIWPTSGNTEIRGTLTTGGAITSGGPTCNVGCDAVFAPEFELDSIEDHASEMWANSYLPAVGPTEANKPMNLTEKTGGMLNELEMAHIYIEQLHTRNLSLQQRADASDQRADSMEQRSKSMAQHIHELEQQNQQIEELVMHLMTNQAEQVAVN